MLILLIAKFDGTFKVDYNNVRFGWHGVYLFHLEILTPCNAYLYYAILILAFGNTDIEIQFHVRVNLNVSRVESHD